MVDSTDKIYKEWFPFHNKLRKTKAYDVLRQLKKRLKLRTGLGILYQHPPLPFCSMPPHYKNSVRLAKPPTISIVTPSYNQGSFLAKTIESVLSQDYPALEYIVQDGGSTDNSVDVLKQYAYSLKHWESKKDNGQSHAINLGFQHATGEIMAYLNSDDILMGGCLHYVAHYFATHPNVDVIYGHRIIIDENDQEIGRWILPPHSTKVLTYVDFIPQETLFWRRSLWEKVGGHIDENFRFAMDWDLLLRFVEAGAKFARLPRFLGAFRVHVNQKTSATMSSIGEQEIDSLRIRQHGKRFTLQQIKRKALIYLLKHRILHKLYEAGILRY